MRWRPSCSPGSCSAGRTGHRQARTAGADAIAARNRILTCATWNIHGCIGRDGRYAPERTRAVLRELDTDLVALQEVAVLHENPGLLEFLTADSGWHAVAGPTLMRADGHYGNAVLTRLPVLHREQVDLSLPRREPRGAIRILASCNGHTIQFLATHLGLQPGERRSQITRLLGLIRQHAAAERPDITLLAGDLNEWFLWGRPLRWLRAHFGSTPAPPSYPAGWPVLALDRIWVDPPQMRLKSGVWKSASARIASDHLPVIATVRLT